MIRTPKNSPAAQLERAIYYCRIHLVAVAALLSLGMPASALGQDFSGFLRDYSGLEKQRENVFMFQSAKGFDVLAQYDSIMIDQPDIMIAADSKYKSMKPDDMKLIADTLRAILIQEFERSNYRLVTTAGPNTLYLNTAITDLHLKKKRKRLIQFTPVGIVATIATTPFRDVMDKINLQYVTFEAELLDSQDDELLGAFVERRGSATEKKEATSWDEFLAGLDQTSKRLGCRLNNGALAADMRRNCEEEYPM